MNNGRTIIPAARFWPKVNVRSADECWPWTAGVAGKGYGQFYISKGNPIGAHRYSWELANGRRVPDGLQVMHSCDNPPCVNPAHLSIGTSADNHLDASRKGRLPGNRTDRGRPRPTLDGHSVLILDLLARGWTQRQVATYFGVSPSVVCVYLKSLKATA